MEAGTQTCWGVNGDKIKLAVVYEAVTFCVNLQGQQLHLVWINAAPESVYRF